MSKEIGMALKEARERRELTQQQVADALGVTRAAVGQWEASDTDPSTENFLKACNLLDLPVNALLRSYVDKNTVPNSGLIMDTGVARTEARILKEIGETSGLRDLVRDVPVYGSVAGGKGADFYPNGEVVDYVRRPPGALLSKKVYALYVTGDSMVPRYEHGDLVYVTPSRPPSIGDYVVIEMIPEEGERVGGGFIKKLVKRTNANIVCEQFNPASILRFEVDRIKALHRVIPWSELLGV